MREVEIKAEYEWFRQTKVFQERRRQIDVFRPVAKSVLKTLLSKPAISNEDLTGLIHLFRPKPIGALASKYLVHIAANKKDADELISRFRDLDVGGYTAPGRFRIHDLTLEQLATVRQFLIDASVVKNAESGSALCETYDSKAVTYVTAGIYSPWLHYLNPEVFPILNNATKGFYKQRGIPVEYPALVRAMPQVQAAIGEHNLGLLDSMAWHGQIAEQLDPKDGAWHSAKWIKHIERADWELFFDACNEVVDRFGFDANSPMLAMNIHQSSSDGVLMNISNRATIDMHLGEGTQVMLMLPKGETDRLLRRNEIVETFVFSKPANAEGTRVTMDTFRSKRDALLPAVMNATEEIISRSQSSPFRKHHIPDLYRMTIDADFRERALDYLLSGKGEWPGSTSSTNQTMRYWAAGFGTDDGNSELEAFKAGDYWQALRYADDDTSSTAKEARRLFAEITAGDHFLIKGYGGQHDLRVHYVGRVKSIDNATKRINLVPTAADLYNGKAPRGPGAGNWYNTIIEVTRPEDIELLFGPSANRSAIPVRPAHDMNTILYGPPGTGKTFQTVVHALAIVDGRPLSEIERTDRIKLRERFELLVKQRRIVMTTFHQSMSYEDFVEGIKPQTDKENGQISYVVEPGIFKRACTEAAYEYLKAALTPEQQTIPFDELFASYTEYVEEQLDSGKEVRIPTRSGKELQVVDISERGNIKLRHVNHTTSREYIVSLERSRALNAAFEDLNAIDNIDREFREVIGGSNGTAYWAVLNQVRLKSKDVVKLSRSTDEVLLLEDKLPHVERIDWSDRDFAQKKVAPFVIIIDEVNRGNIAGIFGELITLVEQDKRAFQAEVAQVVLPYSKKPFAVPPNLYLLGTMNTADRSVEALDTALRRRFSFVEMPSRPDLVQQPDGFAVKLQPLLAAINGRIERLLDKDHHIGHSYFMDIHSADDPEWELRLVFKNKVLPLLQEYFYGDPRKLGAVLGPLWVKKREATAHKLFGKFDIDDAGKDVFDIADPMDVGLDAFAELYD